MLEALAYVKRVVWPGQSWKSDAIAWLAVKRFDYLPNVDSAGRLHMHSACGLLDADFRSPGLDYKASVR